MAEGALAPSNLLNPMKSPTKTMVQLLWRSLSFCLVYATVGVGMFVTYESTPEGLTLSLMGETYAQGRRNRDKDKEDREERQIPTMTLTTADKLGDVQEIIDTENDPQAGLEILQRMIDRGTRRYNGNELANIYKMMAYAYFILDDMPNTILYNEKILEQREYIRIGMESTVMFTLAQLYYSEERYEEALAMIEDWLLIADDPGPNPYFFVATIYYQQENFDRAIEYVELAISMATERGMLPIKKSWWGMLRYLYYKQENFPKVIEILEIMVRDYPERDSWVQLAGMYGQEGFEKKQLYAMESANVLGFFDRETDYLQYQGVLMNAEVAIRAAWYLQEGFDKEIVEDSYQSLNSLGQSYQAALEDDDAIEKFEKATEFAEDGRIFKRLAQLYLGKERFKTCSERADTALEKGGINYVYDVKILKGMCEFNRDRLSAALEIFKDARRDARQERATNAEKSARDWIRYIQNEQKRLRQLAAAEST